MRSCARFDIPSNWWPRRPDRRSGPPRPDGPIKHLREAIDILEETASTKDQREEIQRAVELLDQLIKVIRRDHNPSWYPTGVLGRITRARDAVIATSLVHGGLAGARKDLKAILRDWDALGR